MNPWESRFHAKSFRQNERQPLPSQPAALSTKISGMIDLHRFSLFLVAATLLAIAPGPGMLYVLARTLSGGRREGVLSSLGTFLGGLVHVLAAATGLSIVLATSATAFAVVKYAGAGYLVYLGVRMIISARKDEDSEIRAPSGRSPRNPFWQGIATEVLNPKTAIFFLAFIPQFVNRTGSGVFWQFLLLGTISVALNTSCDLIVTFVAAPIGARLKSSAVLRRRQRTATGLTLIGLGVFVAVSDSK
jgi:threonine/homoserine/homoserine lactone efflux protein